MLNNDIYTVKTLELSEGYLIVSVYSKELNLVGKLKFRNLEDCDGYLEKEIHPIK
jgi:hypothetical protein